MYLNDDAEDAEDARLRSWLTATAAGDDDAFTRLVRSLYQTLYRWALVRTADADDADELVQRSLIRLHRGAATYRGEASVRTWVYRILDRTAADTHRADGRRRARERHLAELGTEEPLAPDDVVETVAAAEAVAFIRGALARLPPRQREIFNLVDLEGHTPAEVAVMLETNPVTVRANLFKARRAVRASLLRGGFDDRGPHPSSDHQP